MEAQIREKKEVSKTTPLTSPAQSSDEQETDEIWMVSDEENDHDPATKPYSSSERAIAEQEWQRLHTNFGNDGYREGLNDGKQRVIQGNFDLGYAEGVPIGRSLGHLLATLETVSTANALSNHTIIPDPEHASQLSQLIRKIQALDVKALFGCHFQDRMGVKGTVDPDRSPDVQVNALTEEAKALVARIGLKVSI
ncbi:hypothetical protein BJ684DRAFT_21451 [Piptocephalis cylindrospora]|uniref:Protein YAE1 n=1 Tax=Piptocephalis cylindrospora TaxID=1907219 RepID=A0A4P9XZW3_9FUNG|nr:hypothetical protein BJ684DRAFT_21451 [Piptocephalis cylindrospora]|eukprot:RKP11977.1 hypothetical protein BJ684DRAFT_21451 [Piptocephalis cylindrospora]